MIATFAQPPTMNKDLIRNKKKLTYEDKKEGTAQEMIEISGEYITHSMFLKALYDLGYCTENKKHKLANGFDYTKHEFRKPTEKGDKYIRGDRKTLIFYSHNFPELMDKVKKHIIKKLK